MRIKLTRTLPINSKYQAIKNSTWEVDTLLEGTRRDACPRYEFKSATGESVIAVCSEAEVIDSSPPPHTRPYKAHENT